MNEQDPRTERPASENEAGRIGNEKRVAAGAEGSAAPGSGEAPSGSPTPSSPTANGPAPDGVSEDDVDALLHQVKVAAGVEDETDEEPESGEQDEKDAAPAVAAPLPARPAGARRMDDQAVQRVLDQSRATAYATGDERRETLMRQRADEQRNRRLAMAVALVLVAVLVFFAGSTIWGVVSNQLSQEAWDEAHAPVAVTLSVSMPSTGAVQGSRIPIAVSGTDLDGNQVEETRYMDWTGTGMELVQGTYALSVPASPIASDGALYQPPADTLSVEVVQGGGDLTAAGTLSFSEIPAADVTDEQISAAATYAASGGTDTADQAIQLRSLAESRRDAAVAQRQAEEDAQREQERAAYLVSTDRYAFEIPEYWRDKVTVRQDGDTVIIYPSDSTNRLATVYVRPASETAAGDIANSLIYQTPLSDGQMLVVWAPRWGYIVATAEDDGSAEDEGYTADMGQQLVDLQTGGARTYASVKADIEQNGDEAESIFSVDDFLNQTIVSTLELK